MKIRNDIAELCQHICQSLDNPVTAFGAEVLLLLSSGDGMTSAAVLISTKRECDYLYGWIKKKNMVTYAKISF